ncbi:hypothetical protein F2Q65_09875 [Thiohalocapsa marina]|uniref:Uncharacterized protein n=1 Tax=Thiohalocapsa marina TaxID=424902 RepID=A0A5M8FNH9_9GAMM|nr:hypothetical protein [Thiohalocapsa marina]KAA6185206.1 hypothetical protein F2Q65_09875 [Thiohalocapsa marina]
MKDYKRSARSLQFRERQSARPRRLVSPALLIIGVIVLIAGLGVYWLQIPGVGSTSDVSGRAASAPGTITIPLTLPAKGEPVNAPGESAER